MSLPQTAPPCNTLSEILQDFDNALTVKARDLLATIAELGGELTTQAMLAERAGVCLRHCKRLVKMLVEELKIITVDTVDKTLRRFHLRRPEPVDDSPPVEAEPDPTACDLAALGIDGEMFLATCPTAAPQLKKNRVKIVLEYLDIGGKVRANLSRWADALRAGNEAIKAITPALRWMKIFELQQPPGDGPPPQLEDKPRREMARKRDSKHLTLDKLINSDEDRLFFNRPLDFSEVETGNEPDTTWQRVIDALQLPASIINGHFSRAEASLADGVLVITAPKLSADWLENRLFGRIEQATRRVCGEGVTVRIARRFG